MRFFLEKTHTRNRNHSDEFSYGKGLWSPVRSSTGKDIYRTMREAAVGDIVFHLANSQAIDMVSMVKSIYEERPKGPTGTPWSGKPVYLVRLNGGSYLEEVIHRNSFLGNEKIKVKLLDILKRHDGLFFNKNLELNQGSYLTELPLELVKIFEKLFVKII